MVNGYRFHTYSYGQNKSTMNSGVCVRGNNYGENELDYYGIVHEVLEVEYVGHKNHVVLFKCHWFDPVRGVRVDARYDIVEVNHKSRLNAYEPFILANQSQQVYYTKYPTSRSKDRNDWWVVCKVKAKLYLAEVYDDESIEARSNDANYYQDEEARVSYIPPHLNNDLNDVLILSDHNHAEEIDAREVNIYVDDNNDEDVEREKEEDYNDDNDFDDLEDDTREIEDAEPNFDSSSDDDDDSSSEDEMDLDD